MITDKDIDNLAELSRLELSSEEKASYAKDLNNILNYISELNKLGLEAVPHYDELTINTMREDVVTTETGRNTEILVKASADNEKNYIKVKKILG